MILLNDSINAGIKQCESFNYEKRKKIIISAAIAASIIITMFLVVSFCLLKWKGKAYSFGGM